MLTLPKRTNATGLSNDELILLDVMFDGGGSFRLLRRDIFRDQWNYPSHDLEDNELQHTLTRMVKSGILPTGQSKLGTYFELTERGGSLWESERQPKWDRYVTDAYFRLTLTGPIPLRTRARI